MYKIPLQPIPAESSLSCREASNSRGRLAFILLFHQSKQLISAQTHLIWAPACHPGPGIKESVPPPSPPPPPKNKHKNGGGGGGGGDTHTHKCTNSSLWLRPGCDRRLNTFPAPRSPGLAFICGWLSLCLCCVCFLSKATQMLSLLVASSQISAAIALHYRVM